MKKRAIDVVGLIHPDNYHIAYSDKICNKEVVIKSLQKCPKWPGWYYLEFQFIGDAPFPMNWLERDQTLTIVARPRRMFV